MGNMNGLTFPWLKLLIVKRRVFARCIFSICVMFSLPLWMASVYCELPLEGLFWDQISLSQWFPTARLLHVFIYSAVPHLRGRVSLRPLLATSVNKDLGRWQRRPGRLSCYRKITQGLFFFFCLRELLIHRHIRAGSGPFFCSFMCMWVFWGGRNCRWRNLDDDEGLQLKEDLCLAVQTKWRLPLPPSFAMWPKAGTSLMIACIYKPTKPVMHVNAQ